MDDHIRGICKNTELPCKNNCGMTIKRGNMDAHVHNNCRNEVVSCPNRSGESLFEEGCQV